MDTNPNTNTNPDTQTLWVCADCFTWHVNGDTPLDTAFATADERLEEVTDGFDRFRAGSLTAGRFHGIDHCGVDHDDDADAEVECETETFSWNPCHVCRDTLGGSRYAITYWPPETPTVFCAGECGTPVDGSLRDTFGFWVCDRWYATDGHCSDGVVCTACGIPVDPIDGVSVDGEPFCGNYRGNGCGEAFV